MSVVLPQPDGPISDTNSPCAISRSMSDKATTGVSAAWNTSDSLRMAIAVDAGTGAAAGCEGIGAGAAVPGGSMADMAEV